MLAGLPLTGMLRAGPDSSCTSAFVHMMGSMCSLWAKTPKLRHAQQLLMCPQHYKLAMRTWQQLCVMRLACSESAMHQPFNIATHHAHSGRCSQP